MSEFIKIGIILAKWKVFETNKYNLSKQESRQYKQILKGLQSLNDDELKCVYTRFIVTAEMVDGKSVLMKEYNFAAYLGLTFDDYIRLRNQAYLKFYDRYFQEILNYIDRSRNNDKA
jgi:hypothetical protein